MVIDCNDDVVLDSFSCSHLLANLFQITNYSLALRFIPRMYEMERFKWRQLIQFCETAKGG